VIRVQSQDGETTSRSCQYRHQRSGPLDKDLIQHEDVDAVWYFGTAEGSYHVEHESAANMKRTWVGYGIKRDWISHEQGAGHQFLHEATQVKNIWVPTGE